MLLLLMCCSFAYVPLTITSRTVGHRIEEVLEYVSTKIGLSMFYLLLRLAVRSSASTFSKHHYTRVEGNAVGCRLPWNVAFRAHVLSTWRAESPASRHFGTSPRGAWGDWAQFFKRWERVGVTALKS